MVNKILKMSASWCGPCKVYKRTFESVANDEKYKGIDFVEVDIEENEDLTEQYSIKSVPTTVFLDENENVLCMLNGNISKSVLEEKIQTFNK